MKARRLLQRVGVPTMAGWVREEDLELLADVVLALEEDARRLQFLTHSWALVTTNGLHRWTLEGLRDAIDHAVACDRAASRAAVFAAAAKGDR